MNSLFWCRFKAAYQKYGKLMIYCHITTSLGWIIGFFILSNSYDIANLLNILERMNIMSAETKNAIILKISKFKLDEFIKNNHIDYVLTNGMIEWLGKHITGQTLNRCLTVVMFYKLLAPLRYILTLSSTKLMANILYPKPTTTKLMTNLKNNFSIINRRKEKLQNRLILNRFKKTKESLDLFSIYY